MSLTTTLSTGTTTATVTTGPQQRRDPFDLLGLAVLNTGWYLITGTAAVLHWAILFPPISLPLIGALVVGVFVGWPSGLAVAVVSVLGLGLWRRTHPEVFDRWITDRARSRFLTWWRYQRNWSRLMKACHLTVATNTRIAAPKLLAVGIGEGTDRVQLRMLEGQCPADYDHRVDTLAHAFRAEQCHATIIGPALVELRFRHGDALAETVVRPRVDHWTKPEGHAA